MISNAKKDEVIYRETLNSEYEQERHQVVFKEYVKVHPLDKTFTNAIIYDLKANCIMQVHVRELFRKDIK